MTFNEKVEREAKWMEHFEATDPHCKKSDLMRSKESHETSMSKISEFVEGVLDDAYAEHRKKILSLIKIQLIENSKLVNDAFHKTVKNEEEFQLTPTFDISKVKINEIKQKRFYMVEQAIRRGNQRKFLLFLAELEIEKDAVLSALLKDLK